MSRLEKQGYDLVKPLSAAQLVLQAPSTALCSSGCGLEALRASALWLILCMNFATPAVLPVLCRNKCRMWCTALRKAVGHVRANKLRSRAPARRTHQCVFQAVQRQPARLGQLVRRGDRSP